MRGGGLKLFIIKKIAFFKYKLTVKQTFKNGFFILKLILT